MIKATFVKSKTISSGYVLLFSRTLQKLTLFMATFRETKVLKSEELKIHRT